VGTFFSSSLGIQLSPDELVREIINFMRADERRTYKVIIGTDSERNASGSADFVTAIVVQRVGNGGRYFWRRTVLDKKFWGLRDRITEEVLISLGVAKDFLAATRLFDVPKFDFEIHVDVGENGATRVMIQELVAMVRAENFQARTKPESYAASNVADRHV
jgi:predicted RNase H-related nuclease YkuK (DUF458 family)